MQLNWFFFFFYLSNAILNQCDIISGKYRKYWCKLNWTTECRHGKSWNTRWKFLTVCLISPPPTKQLNASTAAQLNTTIKCIIQPTAWVVDFLCPSVLSNNVLWQAPSWNQTRKMAKTNALSLTWLGWRAVTVFCFSRPIGSLRALGLMCLPTSPASSLLLINMWMRVFMFGTSILRAFIHIEKSWKGLMYHTFLRQQGTVLEFLSIFRNI